MLVGNIVFSRLGKQRERKTRRAKNAECKTQNAKRKTQNAESRRTETLHCAKDDRGHFVGGE